MLGLWMVLYDIQEDSLNRGLPMPFSRMNTEV